MITAQRLCRRSYFIPKKVFRVKYYVICNNSQIDQVEKQEEKANVKKYLLGNLGKVNMDVINDIIIMCIIVLVYK